jgi:hypothetical protein
MASPPRSPVTLSRLRACSAQLLGLRAFGDLFGGSASAADAHAAATTANDDAGCRESVERSEDCVVVTREGVRLLRCTETLRRLRTCVNAPAQEIEVVEGTTLRRLGGGGGVGTTAAATAATAPAAANNNSSGGVPPVLAPPGGGSIVLNPEASEALQEFMGFADHLASEKGRRA